MTFFFIVIANVVNYLYTPILIPKLQGLAKQTRDCDKNVTLMSVYRKYNTLLLL